MRFLTLALILLTYITVPVVAGTCYQQPNGIFVCISAQDTWLVESFDTQYEAQNALIARQASGDPELALLVPAKHAGAQRYLVIWREFVDFTKSDSRFGLSTFDAPFDATSIYFERVQANYEQSESIGLIKAPDGKWLVWYPHNE